VPEEQDDVPAEQVAAVLACVALADVVTPDALAPTTVGLRGQYAHGVGVGGYRKVAPEYIGATARAARRAARIAEYDLILAGLGTYPVWPRSASRASWSRRAACSLCVQQSVSRTWAGVTKRRSTISYRGCQSSSSTRAHHRVW
jgi:hypothetical protein